jgi:futalosine hydrolase
LTTCIFAAVRDEISLILKELAPAGSEVFPGGTEIYRAGLEKDPVLMAVIGVGIASSALAIGSVFSLEHPQRAIMVGSAGSLPGSDLELGDMVISETEIFSELGVVLEKGCAEAASLRLPALVQEIPMDPGLSDALLRAGGLHRRALKGRALTVAGASADEETASRRARVFTALSENMEGYALALAGRRFGIPVAEIRGISNRAGDRDKRRWDMEGAVKGPQLAVIQYLRSLI